MTETEKVHVLNFRDRSRGKPAAENELIRRARQIGALAGRAVVLLRQAQETLNHPDTWIQLRRQAGSEAEKIRLAAAQRTRDWRRQAERVYQESRQRARETVRDHPVPVAVAAGIAGFIVGAGLRLRRKHSAR